MEKYAHRHNVILGIIKALYNIVKTLPSSVNCGNINAIAMGPTHAWPVQRCHHREFMILFISSSAISAQKENCPHRRNVILGIIKTHYNIWKLGPLMSTVVIINVIAMESTHAWLVQRCHHCEFMFLFISQSVCHRKWVTPMKSVTLKSNARVYYPLRHFNIC